MAESILNVSIEAKSNPTVKITVNNAGVVSGTGSVSPVIKYVSTGDTGPSGAVGPTGSVSEGDTVFRANMAPNSIGSTEIIDGSITNSELQNNSVYGDKILNGGVSGIKLADGSVAGNKLAANSIDATKIADGAITAELLELGLITASQISSKSITASEIANNTLVGALFVDNSVDGNAIENDVTLIGTVTVNHLELEGSSPALIEGPSGDDINIKTHNELNIQNTSGSTVASFDQIGNLTLSGNVDGINIATDVAANTLKTGITTSQSSAITNNTAKATNTVTDLGSVAASNSFTITSSDGQNASLSSATQSNWGVMTNDHVNAVIANTAKADLTVDGAGTIHSNNYTDTVYTHPSNHAISVITGLQTALDSKQDSIGSGDLTIAMVNSLQTSLNGKVSGNRVLTDVPVNAVFTDTVYTHPTNHAISVITGLQTALNSKQDAIGNEDLTIQQTDGLQDALNAKVDDSQVLTNVPANAVFTDTVYTHPSNHAISVITGLQTALDSKQSGIGNEDLTIAMTDGLQEALNAKVDDSQVLTNVPTNALFTDTNTTYSVQDGGLSQNNFTNADHTKLNNIEANATADQTNVTGSSGSCTGNAATATALTSGNKSIAGNLSVTGSGNTFIMDSVQVATITSSRVVIGQTNRILQLDSSQCRVASINLGADTDTTIARVSAGEISVEGVGVQLKNMHHHFIHAGFYLAYPYSRYIPLNGSLNEQNVATSTPEYVNYTFPYDGYVKKMILRSETNMGSTNLKLYKGASGATVTTVLGDVSATVGASAAVEFDFTSVSSAYSKGDTMAIKVDPTEDPDGGQNITIELVFDLTT